MRCFERAFEYSPRAKIWIYISYSIFSYWALTKPTNLIRSGRPEAPQFQSLLSVSGRFRAIQIASNCSKSPEIESLQIAQKRPETPESAQKRSKVPRIAWERLEFRRPDLIKLGRFGQYSIIKNWIADVNSDFGARWILECAPKPSHQIHLEKWM